MILIINVRNTESSRYISVCRLMTKYTRTGRWRLFMSDFTQAIKTAKEEKGYTLRDLDDASDISYQYIKEIIDGKIPSNEAIVRLAAALDLDPTYLVLLAGMERSRSEEVRAIYRNVLAYYSSGGAAFSGEVPVRDHGERLARIPLIAYVSAGESSLDLTSFQ